MINFNGAGIVKLLKSYIDMCLLYIFSLPLTSYLPGYLNSPVLVAPVLHMASLLSW